MKKTALLFPGQGSQYVGMGQPFVRKNEKARKLFAMAEDISGIPLQQLCFEGPMEDLTRVLHLQPALTAVNLACHQHLQHLLPDFKPAFVAGHSLGEYSALHAAGVLSQEDTLRLVTKRGELMEREGAENPGGMRAVLGLTIAELDEIIDGYAGDGVAVVANHNCEKQVVISGDPQGLDEVSTLCGKHGGKVITLKVSVANHSPLVAGAVQDFAAFMDGIAFQQPRISLLFNATAQQEENPAEIRKIMARQIASRVRWFEIIQHMVDHGVDIFVELGPKTVLSGMMKKILPRKSKIKCMQADTPELIQQVVQEISAS